jgi:VanZ family protein
MICLRFRGAQKTRAMPASIRPLSAVRPLSVLTRWLPVVLWMGFIFAMSTGLGSPTHSSRLVQPILSWIEPGASHEQFEFVHLLVRKAAHLAEYAMLGILVLRAIRGVPGSPKISTRELMRTLAIVAVYAAIDEFHQRFVIERTPAIGDVVIDTCGGILGMAASCFFQYLLTAWSNGRGFPPGAPENS